MIPIHLLSLSLLTTLPVVFPLSAEDSIASLDAEPVLHAVSNEEGILITEGESPILHFQKSIKSMNGKWPRAAYVHPLFDLDGTVITEDFPEDHGHHRGIFWAWHQVWVGNRKMGDAWECRDFVWEFRSIKTRKQKDRLSIVAEIEWKSPDLVDSSKRMLPIVAERTTITVHPRQSDHRLIDFEISLRAMQDDVKIGGSEDVKGYGGFSPRIRLSPDQIFTAEMGVVEPRTKAIIAGPWVDLSTAEGGLAILQDPGNPNYPQPWILRRKRSMQNPVFPGRHPVTLSKIKETSLRYRIVIHRGNAVDADIDSQMQAYAKASTEN
ncbi:MAG TPA: hypothetical protein EYQ50_15800 [Verrucomicrobiales bacterium]|nr:hypothetical protein [Verrucomicrobiales bacterium]HIL68409.1 hypothetical protein [Verrucomicrobiota bacterium]